MTQIYVVPLYSWYLKTFRNDYLAVICHYVFGDSTPMKSGEDRQIEVEQAEAMLYHVLELWLSPKELKEKCQQTLEGWISCPCQRERHWSHRDA